MGFRQRACELYELYEQEFLRYDDLLEECKEINYYQKIQFGGRYCGLTH